MNLLTQVASAMQTILTTVSDAAAATTGFVKRKRKLTGAKFVQTLVLSWLANAQATYSQMSQTAATVGVEVSPQAIEQRLTPQAAETLKLVLQATVGKMIAASPKALPLLERFDEVFIEDSSWISLPAQLADDYKGFGGGRSQNAASVKMQLRWELSRGGLTHLFLTDGTMNDCRAAGRFAPVAPGSLRLQDLGYFSLTQLAQASEDGVFWLTRIKSNCRLFDRNGEEFDLAACLAAEKLNQVDRSVFLGASAQLPARLLAQRVSDEVADKRRRIIRKAAKAKGKTPSEKKLALAAWNLTATNVSPRLLTVDQAMVLLRIRWQIELMFKLWKSHGNIDKSRSEKPWRILAGAARSGGRSPLRILRQVDCHGHPTLSCVDKSLARAGAKSLQSG